MNNKDKVYSIYVGGTFDLFHYGHVRLFQNIHRKFEGCSLIFVAVNSDSFAQQYKELPVMNQYERLEVIQACKYVHNAFIMESYELQPHYINRIQPNYIAHGSDWKGKSLLKQLNITEDFLKTIKFRDGTHCRLLYLPYTDTISTTDIKRRILDRIKNEEA